MRSLIVETAMPLNNRIWEYWYAYQGKTHHKHSLRWLAEVVGVSPPTLRRYLNNTISSYDPQVIEKFCDVLDIPIEKFFARSPAYPPETAVMSIELGGKHE